MIEEKRIREMISDFAKIYNSNLEKPNNYYDWPINFSGEELDVAKNIYQYIIKRNCLTSTAIWRITGSLEKEIFEKIIFSNPLQKA